jgi:hypothetical protein
MSKNNDDEYYGNWFDNQFPQDIEENFNFKPNHDFFQDSDGDYYYTVENGEREYVSLTWFRIWLAECPNCHKKYISVLSNTHYNFYKNGTEYCMPCGYPKGVIEYTALENEAAVAEAIKKTLPLTDVEEEIIRKIYPNIF